MVSSKANDEGDGREETTTTPVTITKATYLFVMCASLNSCNLGFDIGVSTEAGRLIQNDLGLTSEYRTHHKNHRADDALGLAVLEICQGGLRCLCSVSFLAITEFKRELFIGSLNFWAMFGALLAQSISDRFGRRMTFVIAAVGFNLGILIMILSHSLGTLLVGRTFIGWGIGIGLSIDPLFIAEITPPQHRGMLVTWSEIAINIGVVFGFATGLFLSGLEDGLEWRVMFLLGAILPTLMIIVVFTIMPESPRWLVQRGRHAEALAILEQVYPEGFDVEPVLESIKEAIHVDCATNMSMGWSFLRNPSPAVFRMLLVGVGAPLAQQAVGIDAIQYYLGDVIAR